jgi:hypothetical protein
MKLRVYACVALALVVAGASALSSRMAVAQAGPGGQGQESDKDRARSGDQSADIDKALKAYEERMGRNLEKCRQELDQMKKELHDLIDMRINMAMSLAELRAKRQMPGMLGFPGEGVMALRQPRGGHSEGAEDPSGLSRELQQIHNQLRSEVEQQQNQIEQLASQLRMLKQQGQQGQPGQSQGHPQAGQGQPGQGQQGRGQGSQGPKQPGQSGNQGGGQSGSRDD